MGLFVTTSMSGIPILHRYTSSPYSCCNRRYSGSVMFSEWSTSSEWSLVGVEQKWSMCGGLHRRSVFSLECILCDDSGKIISCVLVWLLNSSLVGKKGKMVHITLNIFF